MIAQENLACDGASHAAAAFASFEPGVGKAGRAVEDIMSHDQIVFVPVTGTLFKNVFDFHDICIFCILPSRTSSPSLKMLPTCREMTDCSRPNNATICA